MKRAIGIILSATLLTSLSFAAQNQEQPTTKSTSFTKFTGKVSGNQVRLRTEPNLDGKIAQELVRGDLILVRGMEEGYYQTAYPKNLKAYVFRTFVLDGKIEGTNVNVRLGPSLEFPVIAQLNTGDSIEGSISKEHPKWLEIAPPESATLYISTDYVEKVGDASYLATLETKRGNLEQKFQEALLKSQSELRKNFHEVDLASLESSFKHLIDAGDVHPMLSAQAKEALELVRDSFIQKKIAFLEEKVETSTPSNPYAAKELETTLAEYTQSELGAPEKLPATSTDKMAVWQPMEQNHFLKNKKNYHQSIGDYYQEEKGSASRMTGLLESYSRPIKNKPGDYVVRDRKTKMPIAYLYSTHVNLDNFVGQEVSLKASPRPNQHFAFPAYFVHSVE